MVSPEMARNFARKNDWLHSLKPFDDSAACHISWPLSLDSIFGSDEDFTARLDTPLCNSQSIRVLRRRSHPRKHLHMHPPESQPPRKAKPCEIYSIYSSEDPRIESMSYDRKMGTIDWDV